LVTARARRLLDLRGDVLHTARAGSLSEAAAHSILLAILELGLEMLLLGLRLHILHSARASLEVQAAARVFYELVVARTARAVASSLQTGAEKISGLLLEFGFHGGDLGAVACGVLDAVTERVGCLLYLGHEQRLCRSCGSARRSSTRVGSGHNLVVGNAGQRDGRGAARETAGLEHIGSSHAHEQHQEEGAHFVL